MPKYQWLTTQNNPTLSVDAEPRGWRRHAVVGDDNETFEEYTKRRALCGLRARHGWGMDLFIVKRCKRCVRLSGVVECRVCKGYGCTICRDTGVEDNAP